MKTVLVVDDSAMIRRIAKKILEELNFKTGEAEDGQKKKFEEVGLC
jgi:two-component system chemotaxis response regulator CheY